MCPKKKTCMSNLEERSFQEIPPSALSSRILDANTTSLLVNQCGKLHSNQNKSEGQTHPPELSQASHFSNKPTSLSNFEVSSSSSEGERKGTSTFFVGLKENKKPVISKTNLAQWISEFDRGYVSNRNFSKSLYNFPKLPKSMIIISKSKEADAKWSKDIGCLNACGERKAESCDLGTSRSELCKKYLTSSENETIRKSNTVNGYSANKQDIGQSNSQTTSEDSKFCTPRMIHQNSPKQNSTLPTNSILPDLEVSRPCTPNQIDKTPPQTLFSVDHPKSEAKPSKSPNNSIISLDSTPHSLSNGTPKHPKTLESPQSTKSISSVFFNPSAATGAPGFKMAEQAPRKKSVRLCSSTQVSLVDPSSPVAVEEKQVFYLPFLGGSGEGKRTSVFVRQSSFGPGLDEKAAEGRGSLRRIIARLVR